jgi:hypothetical protein
MSDVDIFDDIADAPEAVATDSSEQNTDNVVSESAEQTVEAEVEVPVETVSSVPDGALSVTDFAAYVTQHLMREKIAAGEDLDGSEYTVPQAVYQTVKATRNRIPHILVKADGDTEARVYILRDEALAWWKVRREHIATRGGTTRASNRTPEENLNLLTVAVGKALYAKDRLALWVSKSDAADKLIEKKRAMLATQGVDEATMDLAVQEGTDTYNTDKAAKLAEKAKNSKNGKVVSDDEVDGGTEIPDDNE